MNDDELAGLYREGMQRAAAGPDDGVSLDAMLRVVRGEADAAERLSTLDRVMASDALRKEFALLSAVAEGERHTAPTRRSWWPLAAAAAVLLVAGGVTWQMRERAGDDVVRGDRGTIELVSPRDVLPAGRLFTWRATATASRYRLQVRDAAGGVVFDSLTRDTTMVLPDSVRLAPGTEYRWWIRAELEDGGQARSALVPLYGGSN